MNNLKKIKSALLSVYHKDHLAEIVQALHAQDVKIYSTGGTRDFVASLGIPVTAVEDVTSYPSIFGGRVKTLHPKIFGGILYKREEPLHCEEAARYQIPDIDLVIVDLYPFAETLASGAPDEAIIEKIDIGGISLIRAAAKNFRDVVIVPSKREYLRLLDLLHEKNGFTSIEDRRWFASRAFAVSSDYDTAIHGYFNRESGEVCLKASYNEGTALRYGENPHQKGYFFGQLGEMFTQLHGKEISYNNLLDMDSAVNLISEFTETTFAILKHNNACGMASAETLCEAYQKAFDGDPVSAFGGVLISNRVIDKATAEAMNTLFFELIMAPGYEPEALELLKSKKNRMILEMKNFTLPSVQYRTLLNGVVLQDKDLSVQSVADMKVVSKKAPAQSELLDLVFANKIVKHSKSNAIVLAKGNQLLASGVGQTSRVDALNQAIEKAATFGFDLHGAVMASDAFFPFPDCVEIAGKAGITAIVHPGGSVRDDESVNYCDENGLAMAMTGVRHFKH